MTRNHALIFSLLAVAACGDDSASSDDTGGTDSSTDATNTDAGGGGEDTDGDDVSDTVGPDDGGGLEDTLSDATGDSGGGGDTTSGEIESTLQGVRTAPDGVSALELDFYSTAWVDDAKGIADRRVLRGRAEVSPGGAVAALDGWWDPTDGTFSFAYAPGGGSTITCTGTVVDRVATGSCSSEFPNSSHFTVVGVDVDDVDSYCGTWSSTFGGSGGLGLITTGSVAAAAFGISGSVSAALGNVSGGTITIDTATLDATGTISGTTVSGTWIGLGMDGTWTASEGTCPVLPDEPDEPDADAGSDVEEDVSGDFVPSALDGCEGTTIGAGTIENDLFFSGNVACTTAGNGQLKCWGWQEASWMWLDSPTPTFNVYSTPQTMLNDGSPITNVRQVLSGSYLFCWVTNAGEAWCFGNDVNGERGRGVASTEFIATPTRVTVLDALAEDGSADIQGLYGGLGTTCGIFDEGRFACWGNNSGGLLGGEPWTVQRSVTAVEYFEGETVVDAAGGMCALLDDGTVWCWGQNVNGIIAHPDAPAASGYALDPMQIHIDETTPLTDVVNIESTSLGICAHRSDTSIVCWGGSSPLVSFGYPLGTLPRSDEYVTVVPGTDGVGVLCGADHFVGNSYPCAIVDGTVWCWGVDNRQGILGTGGFFSGPDPEPSLMTNAVEVEAFAGATCAQNTTGDFYCWGLDEYQVPDGTTATFVETPTRVTF